MGDEMKYIVKLLNECSYKNVYELLEKQNYIYSLDSIILDFSNVDAMNMYCYLLYLLSRKETCKNHLLICDFLMFQGTFFYDIYSVIHWHLKLSLKIDPLDYYTLVWIINMFYEHPDSPFQESEIVDIAKKVLHLDPNNSRAKEILS